MRLQARDAIVRPARTSSSEPVWIALQDLVDRCLGNLDLADRILTRFTDGLPGHLRELEELAAGEDLAPLACRAHRLKGEAANVGCHPIHRLASQLEDFARQGLQDPSQLLIEQLRDAVTQFSSQAFTLSSIGA